MAKKLTFNDEKRDSGPGVLQVRFLSGGVLYSADAMDACARNR